MDKVGITIQIHSVSTLDQINQVFDLLDRFRSQSCPTADIYLWESIGSHPLCFNVNTSDWPAERVELLYEKCSDFIYSLDELDWPAMLFHRVPEGSTQTKLKAIGNRLGEESIKREVGFFMDTGQWSWNTNRKSNFSETDKSGCLVSIICTIAILFLCT